MSKRKAAAKIYQYKGVTPPLDGASTKTTGAPQRTNAGPQKIQFIGLGKLFANLINLRSKLKPHGFVLATGLLPLVSKTASHVFVPKVGTPSLGTQPEDVPYARTGGSVSFLTQNL